MQKEGGRQCRGKGVGKKSRVTQPMRRRKKSVRRSGRRAPGRKCNEVKHQGHAGRRVNKENAFPVDWLDTALASREGTVLRLGKELKKTVKTPDRGKKLTKGGRKLASLVRASGSQWSGEKRCAKRRQREGGLEGGLSESETKKQNQTPGNHL